MMLMLMIFLYLGAHNVKEKGSMMVNPILFLNLLEPALYTHTHAHAQAHAYAHFSWRPAGMPAFLQLESAGLSKTMVA